MSCLVAGELAVDTVRLGGLFAQALNAVLLVAVEVALEPEPVAGVLVGAFPRQNMRGNAVEEHAVVARDNRAAREFHERLFEALERFDVEVVGGLVEQQQVAALLERKRQVQAIALATGKHASGLLLVRTLEAECRHIRAARNLGLAHLHVVEAVGHDLPQRFVAVNTLAVLVDVRDLHGFAELQLARSGLLFADDHLEQRRLAYAVGANNAHDAVARQAERQIVDEHAAVEFLMQVLDVEYLGAQARAHRNVDVGEVDLLALRSLGHRLLKLHGYCTALPSGYR